MIAAEELFVRDEGPFESPLDDELLRSIEAELGVELPHAYVALSRTHNGGLLAKTAHPRVPRRPRLRVLRQRLRIIGQVT